MKHGADTLEPARISHFHGTVSLVLTPVRALTFRVAVAHGFASRARSRGPLSTAGVFANLGWLGDLLFPFELFHYTHEGYIEVGVAL